MTTHKIGNMHEIEIPDWIEAGSFADFSSLETFNQSVADLEYGGCASGCYMPAVTYATAAQTMAEHGDDVLQFIEDYSDGLPRTPSGESWSGIAVHYLSFAVELFAATLEVEERDLDDATELHEHFERGNAVIELRWAESQETIIEWRDQDVWQAVEDGFLSPADWHGSAIEYAASMDLI